MQISLRGQKSNCKPNPLIKIIVCRPNIYYSKISERKLKKEYAISSGVTENATSQEPSSDCYLER